MSEGRTAEAEDGLPVPRRYFSVLAIWLALTMSVLDASLANIALPTIARGFQVHPSDAIWIVNAYQIAIVVALLPLASLAEIVGYRRVYMAGLALFTLASLACALSGSLGTLTAARVAQGIGAAGIMSINAALIRFTYPARLLGRGIGLNALVLSLTSAAGPSVAAAILSVATWQWLFAVNVPIGCLALAIAYAALPRPPTIPRRFDALGAALNALTFGLVIGGIDLLTRTSHGLLGAGAIVCGLLSGALLALRGRYQATPLLPIDLLRIPIFSLSITASVCTFAAQMLALVSLPFHFESAMGRTPVEVGLLLTPWPIAVGLVGPAAGILSDRVPAAILGGGGLLLFAVGLAALALMPASAGFADVAWRMAFCGAGFGLFQSPNNRTMIAAAPRSRSGAAGGMLATARLTGQTAGATAVAILFALQPGRAESVALTLACILALAGAAASVARLSARPAA